MTQKQNIRFLLIFGLIAVSLGGWILHLRIHPPAAAAVNLLPFVTGLISVLILPAMFLNKKMAPFAYVINGMMVIIGTITMADISLMRLPPHVTVKVLLFGTLLSSIITLFTNFFIGKGLFELETLQAADAPKRHGRVWRYPNMGWWGVHLVALWLVYVLGFSIWK